MQGHVQGVTAQIANPYTGLGLDHAAENQRAALLKRRLLNAARNLATDESPEAILVREAWQETPSREKPRQHTDQPMLTESERIQPLSLWV